MTIAGSAGGNLAEIAPRDADPPEKSMKTAVLAAYFGAALVYAFAPPAEAGLALTVLDNGNPVPLAGTNAGGNLNETGANLDFSSIGVTATGFPAVPAPDLGTVTLDVHHTGGTDTLEVLVTQTGLSVPTGFLSQTTNTFNGLIGSPGPITQEMFVDGSLLDTVTFPAAPGTATKNFFNLISQPITSDAEEFLMTFNGVQAAEETIAFEARSVPEPATLFLLGAALLLGWLCTRRPRAG